MTTSRPVGRAREVLGRRALNRALLERQMLLRHCGLDATDAIEHLVGMQAQAPRSPYFGLWTRLEGFHPDNLSRLMRQRQVRIALMRSTIHLVTAPDCLALRPLVQPVLERSLQGSYGRHLQGLDLQAVAAAGRALLEQRPRTASELGAQLAEQWPDRDPAALASAVRALVPLVQVPPRGIWAPAAPPPTPQPKRGSAAPSKPSPYRMGWSCDTCARSAPPASQTCRRGRDSQPCATWPEDCGRACAASAVNRAGSCSTCPTPPAPTPDTPAPPRFLPAYDNALLSHADRSRIIADDHRRRMAASRLELGTVLLDGFVRAAWKLSQTPSAATLRIEPFETLSPEDKDSLVAEGARLLALVGAGDPGNIRFTPTT